MIDIAEKGYDIDVKKNSSQYNPSFQARKTRKPDF